jgi:ribonuclease BN (tRNA processing enzyme)
MIRGVDVLLHDAQFLESERAMADLFGHATVNEAISLATEAKVGRLVLLHHAPARTDAQLDALTCELVTPMPVILAAEGQRINIPG